MTDPSWWPKDEETRDLLFRFFMNFAKFEDAMKTGGYGAIKYGAYQPGWVALKRDMENKPLPDGLKKAHQYLWDSPPNKQTNKHEWRPTKPRDDWAFVIDCVKTVRNNLFHGGKTQFDPVRDPKLIRHSNDIIAALVDAAPPDIAKQFHGGGS